MADNQMNELLDRTFEIEGDRFRSVESREHGASGATQVRFEPEDPDADMLGRSLTLGQIDSMVQEGDISDTAPDPRNINKRRSERSRKLDEEFNAPITVDPERWADDPSHYDFPGVDTGPAFREEHPNFDTDDFIEDTLGLD